MVRTRHAGEVKDEIEFLDIKPTRATRNRHVPDCANTDKEDEQDEYIREGQSSNRERRILKRSPYKDDEHSDDEAGYYSRRLGRHRSRGQKSVRIAMTSIPSARTSPRRSTLRKPKRYLDSEDDGLDEDITYERLARGRIRGRRISTPMSAPPVGRGCGTRHVRRMRHAASKSSYVEPDSLYDDEPRRSGRQRKLIYDTFNQKLITMINHAENAYTDSNKDDSLEMEPDDSLDHDDSLDLASAAVPEAEVVPPRKKRRREVDPLPESEMQDMYARVKRRQRARIKRDMYGMPITEEEEEVEVEREQEHGEAEGGEEEEEEESEESESEEEAPKRRSYSLREHRARPQMLEINWEKGKRKRQDFGAVFRDASPPRTRRKPKDTTSLYRSPARRKTKFRRRKAQFHGHSSTSSSSSSSGGDSSDDERRFERRKAKSMAKSRQRCLPMNITAEDVATGVLRDRTKIGASLADIDPMNVDRSVTFESVGGLGKHVRKLKEMIVFPLLYPEVFERFKIQPPRGVLFYGPPGTGKTLVARALANECSTGEKKVAFFMRKGADCLSKWVGESERQLRLLFDQAYQMRPSIIFFDEIDGLAPVRSSRQDQIHSSIVSTLLALMDGLDNRGEVVVIGATNRLDSIDPALRRPGRFDRELLFPLPSVEARRQILKIHTRAWNPQLSDGFLSELGDKCTGYCGADLKALCTEAALHALRRRYPQIYTSSDKLQLDVSTITVNARDFHQAMLGLVPAAQRSNASPARGLEPAIVPLLRATLQVALDRLHVTFPSILATLASLDTEDAVEELASDSEDDGPEICVSGSSGRGRGNGRKNGADNGSAGSDRKYLSFTTYACQRPATHRPRLLLAGEEGQGQSSLLAPAVLHHMERLPVHTLDLPTLYAVTAHTPEESCSQIFREARRTAPSIVYMPHVCEWWHVISDACRATFMTLLKDMDPSMPTLLLATSEQPYEELPPQLQELFSMGAGEVVIMQNPTDSERREYFQDLLLHQAARPPSTRRKAAERMLEQLPVAPAPPPRELTDTELKRLREHEEATLRELRLFLRDVLNKLGRERKFQIFAKPVDVEEVPDYHEIITNPMDMSTMMSKIDLCKYETVRDFLKDIDLIANNALEYNPDNTLMGRAIRHRACAVRDLAQATVEQELDREFEKLCEEIKDARKKRGDSPKKKNIPDFYFTKPINSSKLKALRLDPTGLQVEDDPNSVSTPRRRGRSSGLVEPEEEEGVAGSCSTPDLPSAAAVYETVNGVKYLVLTRRERMKRSRVQHKSPFCKPTRSRFHMVRYYVDEGGQEFTYKDLFGDTVMGDDTNQDTIETSTMGSSLKSSIVESIVDSSGDKFTDQEQKSKDDLANSSEITEKYLEAQTVKVTEPLQLDIEAVSKDLDEEKENVPSPPLRRISLSPRSRSEVQHHSPRISQGHSPRSWTSGRSPRASSRSPRAAGRTNSPQISPRTRSKSPRGKGQNSPIKMDTSESNVNLETSISPMTRSPRTRSAEKPKALPSHVISDCRKLEEITSDSELNSRNSDNKEKLLGDSQTENAKSSPQKPKSPSKNVKEAEASQKNNSDQKVKTSSGNENVVESTEKSNEMNQSEASTSVSTRVTRSRTHGACSIQLELAASLLSYDTPELVIDRDRLKCLLDKVVENTRGQKLEKLQRLFSVFSQCIYHHRKEYNKTLLIQELEKSLGNFNKYN